MMKLARTGLMGCVALGALCAAASDVYVENFQKLGDYAPGVVRDRGSVGIDNGFKSSRNYGVSKR